MIEIRFDKDRAVAYDDGKKIGECVFIETDEWFNIVHTEVNDSYQGQGIARRLVECVIENARKIDKDVIADCSYAKKVIEKN